MQRTNCNSNESSQRRLPCEINLTLSGVCGRMSKRHDHRSNPWSPTAFEHSMIHWILQFAITIALRCVLHRHRNRGIHCQCFVKNTGHPTFRGRLRERPNKTHALWVSIRTKSSSDAKNGSGIRCHIIPYAPTLHNRFRWVSVRCRGSGPPARLALFGWDHRSRVFFVQVGLTLTPPRSFYSNYMTREDTCSTLHTPFSESWLASIAHSPPRFQCSDRATACVTNAVQQITCHWPSRPTEVPPPSASTFPLAER